MCDAHSDITDHHSDVFGARSDISGTPANITGAHFYRSGVVPEVYDHVRVLVDDVAELVARLILCFGKVPEQDGHVPECDGEVPDRVGRVNSCSGDVRSCVGDVPRCVGYVSSLCDAVPDWCDVLRECVVAVQTCDGAEIFLNRPIITRELSNMESAFSQQCSVADALLRETEAQARSGPKGAKETSPVLSEAMHRVCV